MKSIKILSGRQVLKSLFDCPLWTRFKVLREERVLKSNVDCPLWTVMEVLSGGPMQKSFCGTEMMSRVMNYYFRQTSMKNGHSTYHKVNSYMRC